MRLRVKEILATKGISQVELAKIIGITPVGLSRALNGNTTVGTLEKVANALNVPIWQLFASHEEVTNQSKHYVCPVCGAELILRCKI